MKGHRTKFMIFLPTVMLIVAALIVMYRKTWHQGPPQTGNALVTDFGVMAYPRYRIELPEIDLVQRQVSTSRLDNLPPVPLTFGLQISDLALAARLWNMSNSPGNVQLFVRIRSGSDNDYAHIVQAPLKDWKLATSSNDAYAWHPALRDILMRSRKGYTVVYGLESPPMNLTALVVRPFFQGGGNELP